MRAEIVSRIPGRDWRDVGGVAPEPREQRCSRRERITAPQQLAARGVVDPDEERFDERMIDDEQRRAVVREFLDAGYDELYRSSGERHDHRGVELWSVL